ncbi:hypothetical protein ACTFIT_004537 [Dictyostelium discoideum]
MNHEEKIAYTLFIFKIVFYFIFMVLNGFQVWHERKSIVVVRNMVNTKFIIFLCLFLFCLTRVIFSVLFVIFPNDWKVGTWHYFWFSYGVFFVFCEWSFLGSLWAQIVYQFFLSKKMKTKSSNNIKKIYYISSILVGIYLCWQIIIQIIFLMDNSIAILEAIGMVVFISVYSLAVAINGWILVGRMKKSSKKAQYEDFYKKMILKSKILLSTIIIVIIVVVVQDIVINFILPQNPQPYVYMIISNFIVGIADSFQMIMVIFVMGELSFKNYFKFKRIEKQKNHIVIGGSSLNSLPVSLPTVKSNESNESNTISINSENNNSKVSTDDTINNVM